MRETFPHLPCNAGGADVRANIYEEKVTCTELFSFGSAATPQQKFLSSFSHSETLCHHCHDFQSGGIIVLLVACLNKKKKMQHLSKITQL